MKQTVNVPGCANWERKIYLQKKNFKPCSLVYRDTKLRSICICNFVVGRVQFSIQEIRTCGPNTADNNAPLGGSSSCEVGCDPLSLVPYAKCRSSVIRCLPIQGKSSNAKRERNFQQQVTHKSSHNASFRFIRGTWFDTPTTTTSKIWRKEGHTLNVFYQIENWIKRYSEPLNIENQQKLISCDYPLLPRPQLP